MDTYTDGSSTGGSSKIRRSVEFSFSSILTMALPAFANWIEYVNGFPTAENAITSKLCMGLLASKRIFFRMK